MKGLDLAERYFEAFGLPLITETFPQLRGRAAAGLVGLGSECLGVDDDFSRDHDWGPGFCIWLTPADFRIFGPALGEAYGKLPARFEGYQRITSEWGDGRVGVFEGSDFFRRLLGNQPVPQTPLDWLRLQEVNLSVATAGRMFYDPLGEVSELLRKLRSFYPDDVRLLKIAARCMAVGQSGQYNFRRCGQRKDLFGARYAETKFCADLMSLIHLLNRRYAPYFKWLLKSTASLPLLGSFIAEKVVALVSAGDQEERQGIIDGMCAAVVTLLRSEELSDSESSFLVDHGPVIHERIADPFVRELNVWVG